MKRTFLVEIDEHPVTPIHCIDDIVDKIAIGCRPFVVTETTAVHAKEREVLSAALDMMEKNHVPGIEGLEAWGESIVVLNAKARELRALMEGKA